MRRTQAQRSAAMRARLIDAALRSLGRHGYSGTSVTLVVREARVSRGALLHHFPSKNALILAAAEHLLRRAYRVLGELLLGMDDEADRLDALIDAAWAELFDTPMFDAFVELLIASQHDDALTLALRKLFSNALNNIDVPIAHYFASRAGSRVGPRDLFLMTPLLLSGLASLRHLINDRAALLPFVRHWAQLMQTQLRARRGVRAPPPRPANWRTTR